jgi:branched-chain amino acid transport system substrate-binding protein
MAVAEINAAGGVKGRPLRLVFEDDSESVNEGLLVAQRLAANPEVVAVVGHLHSYVTVPAAAIYEGAGLVMLSPTSTDPELTTKGYQHVFRTTFTDQETGRQLAEHAAEKGYRRVAIYYVRNPYGRTLASAFEEHSGNVGVSVVARASYEPKTTFDPRGFEHTLRQWKQLEIDAVFLAAEVPVAGHLIAEMRKMGLNQPVLGGDAMSVPTLMDAGGAAVEGTVVAAAFHAGDPRPEVRRFVEAFRRRYNKDPDAGSAVGYDAIQVLGQALARASSPSPEALTKALRGLPSWNGVTGAIAFDERGDLKNRQMVKLVVRNGRFEPVPQRTASR